jgi:polyisoprenoid-binding protein YceI
MTHEKHPYEIRPSIGSTLALSVFKKGLLAGKRHVLLFDKYGGEIQYDQQNPEMSSMWLVVESRSVICKDNWLDSDQRKKVVSFAQKKMLVSDRFPEIGFTSTGITRKVSDQYELIGNLTLRGIVRPAFIQFTAREVGADRLEFDGETTIRMKDYGIKPPTALLGFAGTKNKMRLRFFLFAYRASGDLPTGR